MFCEKRHRLLALQRKSMAAVTEVKRLNKIKFVSEEQVQGFL
jgi:hypothetical protein